VVQPGANIKDIRLTYRGTDGLSLDDEGNLQIETPYGVLIDERPISYQEINGQQVPVTSSFKLEQQEQGKNSFGFEVENGYDSRYPLIIDPGLAYSTYLGGGGFDQGVDIAVDTAGQAYVTGFTNSTGATPFPTTLGAFDTSFNGLFDAFVTKLTADGSGLVYSTYLGGGGSDTGFGIAVDAAGHAYVTGSTSSTGATPFPTTAGAFDTSFNGVIDAFVTKIIQASDLSVSKTDSPDPVTVGNNLIYTINVTNTGPDTATGVILTDTLPAGVTFVSATPSQGSCSQSGGTVTCNLSDLANGANATVMITVIPTTPGTITNTATVLGNEIDPNTANNTDTESTTVLPLPQQQIQDLINEVNALHNTGTLNQGQTNSLIAKLNASIDSLNHGQQNAACNQLQAFINKVIDLINAGVLTTTEGQSLIDFATLIRNQIGCTP
jgi:uncharacterized repeat protein (TIGR01451 family)